MDLATAELARLKTTNETFKEIFGSRMQTEAIAEVFDMKSVRGETYQTYREFCSYVHAMANATDAPLFTTALNLLNTARSYYADMMARRNSKKKEEEAAE